MAKGKIRQKTVLVVDDDQALTGSIANLLRFEGYEVSTAYNGVEGYAQYFRRPTEFVITDIQMPEWDGFQMISSIRAINPAVKAIYISGAIDDYRVSVDEQNAATKPFILEKPFTRRDLISVLNENFVSESSRDERSWKNSVTESSV